MKNFKIIVFTLSILISFPVYAGTYSGGNGNADNPYRIATTEDLIELSLTTADWGSNFIQTSDITFDANEHNVDWDGDGTASWDAQDQLGFSPIGNSSDEFTGNYNGQNHTISNIYIYRSQDSDHYIGLFGFTLGCIIQNIGVQYLNIEGRSFVGGLVGHLEDSEIFNCYSTGEVEGYNDVGALVGLSADSEIFNCNSTGEVEGYNNVGGLIGSSIRSKISNCYSTGNYVRGFSTLGGLIGQHSDFSTISCCFSTGDVEASEYVGGLIGHNEDSSINNSYSTGDCDGVFQVGGFCGRNNSTIKNCYSLGKLMTLTFIFGGFVGLDNNGTYECCFWNNSVPKIPTIEDSGNNGDLGIEVTGLAEEKFKDPSYFRCFDFKNIWFTESMLHPDDDTDLSGKPYPLLRNFYPDSMIIPTLTEWAVILFIGLLAGVGGWFVWRRA